MFRKLAAATLAVFFMCAPAFASQQLATRNADSQAIDFGTITFAADGMHVTRGRYTGVWPGLTAGDVTLSTVADDYALPPGPTPEIPGRDLTEAEFVKLGMSISMTGINNALKDLPVFAILLRQYTNERGLSYHDAVTADGNALNAAIATLVTGNYFTADQRDAFLAAWRATYPPGS